MRSTNLRLVARMIVAIVATLLAALALYFVFLHGKRPAHDEVQRMDQRHGASPASVAQGFRHLIQVNA
jgi:hypothetical protein